MPTPDEFSDLSYERIINDLAGNVGPGRAAALQAEIARRAHMDAESLAFRLDEVRTEARGISGQMDQLGVWFVGATAEASRVNRRLLVLNASLVVLTVALVVLTGVLIVTA